MFFALALTLFVREAKAETPIPKVTFYYASEWDEKCQGTAYATDLPNQLNEYQKAWDDDGPELLRSAVEILGRSFPSEIYEVGLMTCRRTPSQSLPMIVNVRSTRPEFTDNDPYPPFVFVTFVFHELLHRMAAEYVDWEGSYMAPFANLEPLVRNHIPVFLFQRIIYQQLGWELRLEKLEFRDRQMGEDYARAQELVSLLPLTAENIENLLISRESK
ncbi:MAG: hypothetical protein IT289_03135 [Oligoflexia bacterium]|nr:hypothetical protein [Oligoflexia bacterium]